MSRNGDDFGDRMKAYESVEAKRRLDVHLPICARIDGRSFSKFTRGFQSPFDRDLSQAMRVTCSELVKETHAKIGFVQSDEISLIFQADSPESSVIFDGRIQKMTSVLAAMATALFTREIIASGHWEAAWTKVPVFDARVWQVPSAAEAANVLLWRAMDAKKNAVSSACRAHYSAAQMHGKDQAAMKEMLSAAGIDFDTEYSAANRFGVFYRRSVHQSELPESVWEAIPASSCPASRTVVRSRVEELSINYFGDVTNREAVIFESAAPIEKETINA